MPIKILSEDGAYLFSKEQHKIRKANKEPRHENRLRPTPRFLDLLGRTTLGRCEDHEFSFCPAGAARWPALHTDKGLPNLRAQSEGWQG